MSTIHRWLIVISVLSMALDQHTWAQDVDPNYYYRLTTMWQGDTKSLDVIKDGTNNRLWITATASVTGQFWKLTPLSGGFFRLTTAWLGDGKSLDIINDGQNNTPTMANTGNYSGQYWKFSPVSDGYYRLTTSWQGDGKSLDIVNDGKNNNRPVLANTGNYSGQYWKLTRLHRIEEPAVQSAATNLALGKFCSTSSRSQWSGDEQGAVDGVKNGGFGFHTDPGPAWWQVDLGSSCTLVNVVIFNRTDCCSERARYLQVLLSNDGANFTTSYAHNGSVFGGVSDGRPLNVTLHGASARYVRLQITSGDYLHLDEVEVYGVPAAGDERRVENQVLDLQGGYVDCGNPGSLKYSRSFTLEAKIFANSWAAESWRGSIIGKDDWAEGSRGFVLRTGDNGRLSMTVGPVGNSGWPEVLSQSIMKLKQWHHVAGTYDGSALKLYIDGQPAGSAVYNGSVAESPYPLKIGASGYDDSRLFDGRIDNVRIWNRALSADEIRSAVNAARTGNEEGLALMYDFDESVAGRVKDGTSFGNHGTFKGKARLVAALQTTGEEDVHHKTGGGAGGVAFDFTKYKLNLPQEVGILLTLAGVSQEDTDLACTVLGAAAYVVQNAKSISIKKSDVNDLLQKVLQLKSKKIYKIPFFQKLIANGEKDLNKMLKTMK